MTRALLACPELTRSVAAEINAMTSPCYSIFYGIVAIVTVYIRTFALF